MIDSLFFDSDCISAFLWVNEQNLIALLYPGMVVIPKPAYDELSYPTTPLYLSTQIWSSQSVEKWSTLFLILKPRDCFFKSMTSLSRDIQDMCFVS